MNALYLDASAITKLVLAEPESEALRAAVTGRTLATSRVSVVEVGKAVARVDPSADTRAILALLAFVELDAELAAGAAVTGTASLRALDAIHVASALRLGADVDSFLTYDLRQAEAAAAVGLRVLTPGRDESGVKVINHYGDEVMKVFPVDRGGGSGRTIDGRTAGQAQADADRAEIRRLVAMDDRDREAFFLASNRNVLRMIADARRAP